MGEQRSQGGPQRGVIFDRYRFYPIPAAAIATNPLLEQTPGWANTGA